MARKNNRRDRNKREDHHHKLYFPCAILKRNKKRRGGKHRQTAVRILRGKQRHIRNNRRLRTEFFPNLAHKISAARRACVDKLRPRPFGLAQKYGGIFFRKIQYREKFARRNNVRWRQCTESRRNVFRNPSGFRKNIRGKKSSALPRPVQFARASAELCVVLRNSKELWTFRKCCRTSRKNFQASGL